MWESIVQSSSSTLGWRMRPRPGHGPFLCCSYYLAAELSRKKRFAVEKHDSVWGTDVPDDQKIWTTSSKVILFLFPALGVGKVMLRMETLNYRLGLFVNATLVSMEALNDEVSQIRLMVLQNRLVLDLLTAASGGVLCYSFSQLLTHVFQNNNGFLKTARRKLKTSHTTTST